MIILRPPQPTDPRSNFPMSGSVDIIVALAHVMLKVQLTQFLYVQKLANVF